MTFPTFCKLMAAVVLAVTIIFIGAYLTEKQSYRHELATYSKELKQVSRELQRRAADDCIMERTEYGYQCKEIKSGKVFKVVLR